MITIDTYIKNSKAITAIEEMEADPAEYFILFNHERVLEYVEDYDYIEGAIVLTCDDIPMMQFRHWDLVDQLWEYLVQAAGELLDGKQKTEFYFPDQPIFVCMEAQSDSSIRFVVDQRSITVNRKEFLSALFCKATDFFECLQTCRDKTVAEESKERIEEILRYVKKL